MSSFIHATEDPDKVLEAVKQILPKEHADGVVFNRSNLTGHHKNPIVLLEAKIKNKVIVEAFIEKLAGSLKEGDKKQLSSEIKRHVDDKGSLYLRLDKQEAFFGYMRLGHADSIRVRMKLRHSRKRVEEIVNVYRSLNLL